MYKQFSMNLAGRELKVDINRVAELASGSALVQYGDTVVLATATASQEPREDIDFFPMSVDYEERLYSVGKIPGGFIKREGKPTENAILASRVIDRSIRPLFPKDYKNDVSINTTVMSVDQDCSPEITALIGASIALSISNIPFLGPIGGVSVGYIDGEFIINPTAEQREKTDMAITVSSSKDKIVMIEAGANEMPEDIVIEGIYKGHEENKKIVEFINKIQAEVGKEKSEYEKVEVPEEAYETITSYVGSEKMEQTLISDAKQERQEHLRALQEEVKNYFTEINPEIAEHVDEVMYKFAKKTVRNMIYNKHQRVDGRKLDEIRELHAEVDILPRTHGSAIFSRGQTQVMTVTTLGAMGDIQVLDGLDALEDSKRYMHHYNFPGYSVGEPKPARGPGRREIGHGALAERALLPVIPSEEEFPYAIRLVSEVLSSNGSTSQASVCGSTLSLMAAGVPIKAPVAGISVGLVTGDTEDEFVTLTDIQGLEDFFGDMDFKVAGTKKGITAIQMDIKVLGLTRAIVEKAIYQAREARIHILDDVMLKVIEKPREQLSKYAPLIEIIKIDPEKISEVIGSKGKVINKIIEETGVKIDIEDDGKVFVCGTDSDKLYRAINIIKSIAMNPEPGQVFNGTVIKTTNFGAFVEIVPGKEGLVHISKLSKERVAKAEDVVKPGDKVTVKVLKIDEQGRIDLTMVLEE